MRAVLVPLHPDEVGTASLFKPETCLWFPLLLSDVGFFLPHFGSLLRGSSLVLHVLPAACPSLSQHPRPWMAALLSLAPHLP